MIKRTGFFALLMLLFLMTMSTPLSIATDGDRVENPLFLAEDLSGRGIETLKDLPVELYLRKPPHYLLSAPESNLRIIEERGFTINEIERVDVEYPIFLLTRPFGMEPVAPPTVGDVLYDGGNWFLVRAPQGAVSHFGAEGFLFSVIPLRPLPLEIPTKSAPSIGGQANLSSVARGKVASSDSSITSILQRLQDFQTRYSYTDSVIAAAEWLHDQFVDFGFTDVEYDSFWAEGRWQRNIVATKTGRLHPDKIILIGGHYDSAVYGDTCDPYVWAPGVDDNGTGTAITLDIARILADEELDKTLMFVPFAAEEQGLYGSWHFAEEAYDSGMDIELMVNMDMVGNLDDTYLDVDIDTDDQSMAYAELMSQVAEDSTNLIPRIGYSGWGSDHYPFMQYGYNHVYAQEGDFSPNWHRCSDIIDNVDIPYLIEVENMVLPTVVIVANAKAVDVEIDCPIDSVSQGGTVPFTLTVANVTDSTATTDLTLWVKRSGGPEMLFFGPRTLTLDPGQEITRNPSIGVPDNAPPGNYVVSLEAESLAGDLIDRDSFTVTVIGRGDAVMSAEDRFLVDGL